MNIRFLLLLALSVFSVSFLMAQCPTNAADLADGGTFSSAGTCNVAAASIVITGNVIWNGPGFLSINGNTGNIDIASGGSLTINSGTVRSIDGGGGGTGDLDVLSGGSVTVAAGATLLLDKSIEVYSGASMTISGTLQSQDSEIDINEGGTITVNATGTIQSSTSGANANILVQGTLINSGTVDSDEDIIISSTGTLTNSGTVLADDDIDVDGTITNSGTIDAADDIALSSTASLTNSGTFQAADNIDLDGTITNSGAIDAGSDIDIDGTVINSGTMNATNEFLVDDGGSLTSSGAITADDFRADNSTVIISSGGTLDVADDLMVYDGGSLTIDAGGSVNAADDILNDNQGGGGSDQGFFIINGTMTAGDNFTIQNTTPNSSATGSGTITIQGTYSDAECPATGDFCLCTGNAVGPCTGSGPLPVELISFSAKLNYDIVKLQWSTASELNNDYFTIERATNIETFETIGDPIGGKGTTAEKNNYVTQDENPLYGRSYYRLKQTDFDGQFTYSEVQVIDYEGPRFSTLRVYPNPSKGLTLTIEVSGLKDQATVPVQIYNVQGQKVYDRVLKVSTPGTLKQDLQFGSPLKHGLYIIKAGQTLQLTQKILID